MYMEKVNLWGLIFTYVAMDMALGLACLHYTTLRVLKNDILLNGLASCWNVRLKSVVHHRNFVLTLPSGSSYWQSFLDIVTVLPPPVAFLIRPPTLHHSVRYCLVLYIALPPLS